MSYEFEPKKYEKELKEIVKELVDKEDITTKVIDKILKQSPRDGNAIFSRDQLISGIRYLATHNLLDGLDHYRALEIIDAIKLKPMRTESGVTTVTVLTKPFPCPGKCIFCPNDVRMPKSYIATEPGAQRALANRFSPYLQTYNRLQAIKNIGHPTDKVELLVLGGTWSSYSERYQIWFIKECFRAMNNFGDLIKETKDTSADVKEYLKSDFNDEIRKKEGELSYNKLVRTETFKNHMDQFISNEENATWEELKEIHEINSTGKCRCVGLVLETRPDHINEREVLRLRKLGATKIQIGVQTLDDTVSELNQRGETKEDTAKAFRLLRAAGFKIHVHIMPNLYGATPEIDKNVYKELFESKSYKPDEVKIYPTSTIKYTELSKLYEAGKYTPYSAEELIDLIAFQMENTPEYCRLTRIIRDIPSTEIEAGNKTTNLREVVEHKLKAENRRNPNIRAREVGILKVKFSDLVLDIQEYDTIDAKDFFLQYITKNRTIAGFLRLSIPKTLKPNEITPELDNCAMIREVHVYGPSLEFEKDSSGQAQHLGLGTKLIEKAKEIAIQNHFDKLAVISSIGTREYYAKRGFQLNEYYQIANL